MPTFAYDELPTFKHEAKQELIRHRQRLRLANGATVVADMVDILDAMPLPESTFEMWHKAKSPTLVADATAWHAARQQAAGGVAAALNGEALLEYYFSLLDAPTWHVCIVYLSM